MADSEAVYSELKEVFDPEIPVNIVDLGLIYDVQVENGNCVVTMTLTSQACPEAKTIPEVVKRRVTAMEGVEAAEVNVVWEPQWGPHRITPEGRAILGIDEPEEGEE